MPKNIIWIASYPKSGNTWMRSIIASLLYTENGEFDFELLKKIGTFDSPYYYRHLKKNKNDFNRLTDLEVISKYRVEAQNNFNLENKLKFFKTHSANISFNGFDYTNNTTTKGVIYLVRDPRDIVVSYSKFINKTYDEVIQIIKKNKWVTLSDESKYPSIQSSWDENLLSWKNLNVTKIFVKYEHLLDRPINTVNQIINFLKHNMKITFNSNNDKISNIIQSTSFKRLREREIQNGFSESSSSSKYFRVGKKNQWKENLNNRQKKEVEDEFGELMQIFGYLD